MNVRLIVFPIRAGSAKRRLFSTIPRRLGGIMLVWFFAFLTLEFRSELEVTMGKKNIFMTGGTGALGAFLLREILLLTDSRIILLVREREDRNIERTVSELLNLV